ncbi:MAG TPA: response regulator [Herpetosiphonaceae bacterium]|nr:response regulator [Herpetosiphonaceae bacterium]
MTGTQPLTLNRLLFRLILFRLFLPLLLITVVALGLAAYPVITNVTDRQLQLTRSLAHTVNSYLDQTSRVLATVAQTAEHATPTELNRYMDAVWQGYGYFDALYCLDGEGHILQLVPPSLDYQGLDMSRQAYFQSTRGQTTLQISKPFISPRTGQPTIYLAWPLSNGGVIVGELNLGSLQQTITAANDAENQDTVFIADQLGTLLAHPRFALVAQQMNVGNLEITRQGLQAETTIIYTGADGIILASATPIGQTHWVVVAEVPLQTAFGPIMGVLALMFLLFLIVWIVIARSLQHQFERHVATPLARLGQGADALAAGDFDRGETMLESPRALAEIAALGANFQRMSRSVQARQAALQESEIRLRLILEHMPVMLDAFDEDYNIIFWNKECERVTGYSAAEMISNPAALEKLYPSAVYRQSLVSEWADPAVAYRHREREMTTRDQQIKIVAWSTISAEHPIPGWKFWSIGMEITERRRLEEQLRQSQKMQAIGQLAGGVAHDFNNLLTVILGHTDLGLTSMYLDEELHSSFLEIQKAGRQAASLTQQLLAFSRRQILQPKVLDLNHTIVEMKDMLRRLIGENIDLVITLGQPLDLVKVDPGQMQQVIMNLVINARDAMERGGTLTIETRMTGIDSAGAGATAAIHPGAYVLLTVADTGIGMDAETMSHIFEPFFTTKDKSKGTGLGLATTHGIITQSGGFIEVISQPDCGCTFNVYIPRADAALEADRAGQVSALTPVRAETILLVEDEAMVRDLVNRILDHRGYHVLQADHGAAALALCDSHGGPIDLLLTDVVMPGGMNGGELGELLRQRYPALKIIYMSGYTDSVLIKQNVASSEQSFLPKPFTPQDVLHRVQAMLDKSPLA